MLHLDISSLQKHFDNFGCFSDEMEQIDFRMK